MNQRTLVAVCLLFFLLSLPAQAEEATAPITVYVEDNLLQGDQAPFLSQGRTLVPLRAIFEALGAQVYFDEATRTIVASHPERDRLMVMQVDQPLMAVTSYGEAMARVQGGQATYRSLGQEMGKSAQRIDVAPLITSQGRTMVPVRVVSEALGSFVSWDGATKTVYID